MRSEKILAFIQGPDVLDVGCAGHSPNPGSPYWLHGRLRERFPSIVGLDLSDENIRRLAAQGFTGIHLGSAEDFEFKERFDTIVAGELIEHLSNPAAFLAQCKKHLKAAGRVVLSTPYPFSLLYVLYAFLKFPHTCQNDEHTMWLCPNTLRELSSRSGFRIRHWELVEDYEFDNPSTSYKLFAWFMATIGRITIPGRLRKNALICVLVPNEQETG